MPTATRWPITVVVGACLSSAAFYGVGEWLSRLYSREEPPYFVAMLTAIIVPLLVALLPTAAIAWLGIVVTRPWHRGSMFRVASLSLPMAAMLYVFGSWLRGLYGLDPPYVFFFEGWAMQLIGLTMPFVVAGWACAHLLKRRRGRSDA